MFDDKQNRCEKELKEKENLTFMLKQILSET